LTIHNLFVGLRPEAPNLFFQLVAKRYEKGAMILTSNLRVRQRRRGAWRRQIRTFQRRQLGKPRSFLRDGARYGRRLLCRRLECEILVSADPEGWRISA